MRRIRFEGGGNLRRLFRVEDESIAKHDIIFAISSSVVAVVVTAVSSSFDLFFERLFPYGNQFVLYLDFCSSF